jgi:Cof subfamily protein (haloacid dehalogenase superfamily)
MNSIQIIFFDIDGTLVNPRTGCISHKTKATLNRLRENGIRLFIATGRPPASLPDLTGVTVDGFITVNGSLCYTGDTVIHHNPIPKAAVRKVMENAAALGRPVSVAVRDRLAANGWDEDLAEYYRLAGGELTVAADFDAVVKQDVYQIMLGCREKDHPAIIRDAEGADITFSWPRAADVIPAGSGKAEAIRRVLKYYGLETAQAMAFGDGCNDMEMLQTVGTGIAMGNADPRVKAIADTICGPVSEEGIYRYCLEQGLI